VGEKFFGLGERFDPFVNNGQVGCLPTTSISSVYDLTKCQNLNEDGGTGSELTYKDIPFFINSAGYTVFIPTSNFISFEIQSERTTRVKISVPGETLAMYLIYGPDPKSIIEQYTTITGKPALPPA
jgi:alpha-D-xyloside xylohydrolase